ncbi:MAG: uracil-DNA glycosylase [Acetobacteraceae bacterium]|nr:uracil-DNA glycosylase [Acetobacteraceae bacterium]
MDALTLLRLQLEWGADEALETEPVNRLRATPRAPLRTPNAEPHPSVPSLAPHSAAQRAEAAAAKAATLDQLRGAVTAFTGCPLRDTATNLVFAEGDPHAELLLIGDPPGADEDRSGHPFAGAAGTMLDAMLASIGLSRERLLLVPVIPWRAPGGRPPSASEVAVCLPFLHRLIALAAPRRILLVGELCPRYLLGSGRRRATTGWVEVVVPGLSSAVPAIAIPAPGTLMRTPSLRRAAWTELRLLRRAIDPDLADS